MSTITTPPPAPPAGWIPSPLARLTVEQYEAMVDSGVFAKRDRFQLIDGLLVAKVTKNRPHVVATEEARRGLERTIPTGWYVTSEAPICLPPKSEPEPDVALVRGELRDYASHPGASDLAIVVEVADSSVSDDRDLVWVYGPAGIPVYWIVNLVDRRVEVYTGPNAGGYQSRVDFEDGDDVPVVIDGVEVGRIAVADILP